MKGIQYTIRGIPEELDTVLREEAVKYGKSLNTLLIEKLSETSQVPQKPWTNGLEKFAGCMEFDQGFEDALEEMRMIHPDEWPELNLPPHPLQGVPRP